jgi:hypothetical protein
MRKAAIGPLGGAIKLKKLSAISFSFFSCFALVSAIFPPIS